MELRYCWWKQRYFGLESQKKVLAPCTLPYFRGGYFELGGPGFSDPWSKKAGILEFEAIHPKSHFQAAQIPHRCSGLVIANSVSIVSVCSDHPALP